MSAQIGMRAPSQGRTFAKSRNERSRTRGIRAANDFPRTHACREILLFQRSALQPPMQEKRIHQIFVVSVLFKGAPRADRDRRRPRALPVQHRRDRRRCATPDELIEDRDDWIASTCSVRPQLLGRGAPFLRFLSAQPRHHQSRCWSSACCARSCGPIRRASSCSACSSPISSTATATPTIALILLQHLRPVRDRPRGPRIPAASQTPPDPLSATRNAAPDPRRRHPRSLRGASSPSAISTASISATRRWSGARSRAASTSGGR